MYTYVNAWAIKKKWLNQTLRSTMYKDQNLKVESDLEQDMRVALFNGIYFGRICIRCEPFRPTPPVTQCYECQGFNQVAKDCRSQVKYMRCAKSHKSAECLEKERIPLALCTNCNGDHVAASRAGKAPKQSR